MDYEAVIGLEVHAELQTESKMFCSCPVVDATLSEPNSAVCPICAGMPGVLPVINEKAVEYGLKVALALECEINLTSIFARKNYFYPDLPKGYQITQYEQPLARHGLLEINTAQGQRFIRIRRVHLEEDTGKLTHVNQNGDAHSLIDLNRAGIPLLEIVTEPDLQTAEEVRAYATGLRSLLRYLGVNTGDMQKGVMRIEPNVSVRPTGRREFGTRTEIKNLNSFRALERAVEFEIQRQSELLEHGKAVIQQTMGWDEVELVTVPQRSKEEAFDYRYFPEPDLPPLVLNPALVAAVQAELPELPLTRQKRFQKEYALSAYDAEVLTNERSVADYFEAVLQAGQGLAPKTAANWITGDIFSYLNQNAIEIQALKVAPRSLADLLTLIEDGEINQSTGKTVLAEMLAQGSSAGEIVAARGLRQVSDHTQIAGLIDRVLQENPAQVQAFIEGKETLSKWFFGQVMRAARGQANPQVVQVELERRLERLKN